MSSSTTRQMAAAVVLLCAAALLAGGAAAQAILPVSSHVQDATAVIRSGNLANVLASYYPLADVQKGVYLGEEYCLSCHSAFKSFRETLHASFIRRPMTAYSMKPGLGVMCDLNANGIDDFIDGLDFNTISSAFDAYKPNAPKLSVKNGVYTVSVNGVDYPVILTLGGVTPTHGQRYVIRFVVSDTPSKLSDSIYFAPISWDPVGKKYTVNGGTAWWDATNKPKWDANTTVAQLVATGGPSNYQQNCLYCHSTGMQSMAKTEKGEWTYKPFNATAWAQNDPTVVDVDSDGKMDLVNITCENCHGPGSNHVLGASGVDPTKIINPRKLTAAQQAELCARCHINSKSKPNGLFSFPVKDDTMTEWYPGIGQPLGDFFTDATSYWPDGKLQKSGRPWGDFHNSKHFTNPFHVVSCTECHDLHTETHNPAQVRETRYDAATKLTIFTSVEENTFCLSCHATHGPFATITKQQVAAYAANEEAIAHVVEEHSHHPYAPERMMGLGRCVTCHMAPTGGNHSWRAVAPELTIKYKDKGGMPNSCGNGCHNTLVNVFGLGMRPTSSTYDGAFDQKLATELQKYYGPGGLWWDTHGTPMKPSH